MELSNIQVAVIKDIINYSFSVNTAQFTHSFIEKFFPMNIVEKIYSEGVASLTTDDRKAAAKNAKGILRNGIQNEVDLDVINALIQWGRGLVFSNTVKATFN